MINRDRIVPSQAVDLLTQYGTMMNVNNISFITVTAVAPAIFELTANVETGLLNEPLKTMEVGEFTGEFYFVPAYDYAGFTKNGAPIEASGATVEREGYSLYKATVTAEGVTLVSLDPSTNTGE